MAKGAQAANEIVRRIQSAYPKATYELEWRNPFELLIGALLAAQSTDTTVNRVTPELFARYPDAHAFAAADAGELAALIRPCGLQGPKARSIIGASRLITERFGGAVPRSMEEMLLLPGVQRKTANVVLNCGYGVASGIIVDTHVKRLAQRIGLSAASDPEAIEQDLMRLVPESEWTTFGPALILHGRRVCTAKAPACEGGSCIIDKLCVRAGLPGGAEAPPASGKRTRSGTKRPRHDHEESLDSRRSLRANASATAGPGDATAAPFAGPLPRLPGDWQQRLGAALDSQWFRELWEFVQAERARAQVFPPEDQLFTALELTSFADVRVVLLGQDPYHDDSQAHGLCFSVAEGVTPPPSLRNMFKELESDLCIAPPTHGCLTAWARQGVLLLNAVLTVRAHEPNSHKDRGWERFTDLIIDELSARPEPVVFALWGAYAQKKGRRIDAARHIVLKAAHPSPLSAAQFLGSRPFSAINEALRTVGHRPIDWRL